MYSQVKNTGGRQDQVAAPRLPMRAYAGGLQVPLGAAESQAQPPVIGG